MIQELCEVLGPRDNQGNNPVLEKSLGKTNASANNFKTLNVCVHASVPTHMHVHAETEEIELLQSLKASYLFTPTTTWS